ncbi:hypothetical protein BDQ17DRAFT_1267786, partial [Cyathus striatus]
HIPEPICCLHCQHFGHYARECKLAASVCARCAGPHTTMACTIPKGDFAAHQCINCGQKGHGAAAHSCSVFVRRL